MELVTFVALLTICATEAIINTRTAMETSNSTKVKAEAGRLDDRGDELI